MSCQPQLVLEPRSDNRFCLLLKSLYTALRHLLLLKESYLLTSLQLNNLSHIGIHNSCSKNEEFSPTPYRFLDQIRSEEHTSELQSRFDLVCRLLLEKKKL